jgi:hypothetical protein
MKTFERMAAQGDFIIIRVNEIPANLKTMDPENGKIVVAHSETGHNHVMEAERVTAYVPEVDSGKDLYEMFLKVEAPTPIDHLRSYHTHESIMVNPGLYRIKRQREHTPEGWRRAAD